MTRPSPRARALALAAAAALACAAEPPPQPPLDGTVDVVLAARAEDGEPGPASAWVRARGTTAAGAPFDRLVEAAGAPGLLAVSLALPAGSYELSAQGYADRAADPASAAAAWEAPARPTVAVTPGAARVALLVLERGVVAPDAGNHAPRVQALVASARTLDPSAPGAAVDLAAFASDPDAGDVAAVSWSVAYDPPLAAAAARATDALRAAPGDPGASGTTTFTAPAGWEGTATLTATATDSQLATSAAALAVEIGRPKPVQGTVAVTALVNVFPEITSIAATPGAQLLPGASTTFSVTARDPNGDALRYAWSDGGCGGTFAAPAAATTRWTAPTTTVARSCRIEVLVRDLGLPGAPSQPKGGSNTAFLVVSVRPGAAAFGPEFVFATQSPVPPLAAGARSWFQVAAVEGGTPLPPAAYAWSDGRGGTFTPVVAGDPRYVGWTVPQCGGATSPVDLTVTATATGSAGTATFPFPVRVSCP